jgi:hypothetical protein
LEIKLGLEQVKNELKNTCLGVAKICNYSVNSNLIQVFFTNKYTTMIEQIKNQSISSNSNPNEKIINHISQLEKNFKYISSKYSTPLEVYHPNGDLMIKYQPEI